MEITEEQELTWNKLKDAARPITLIRSVYPTDNGIATIEVYRQYGKDHARVILKDKVLTKDVDYFVYQRFGEWHFDIHIANIVVVFNMWDVGI